MAIQDKFVSSFAELYIADRAVAGFSDKYNAASDSGKLAVVRDFFAPKVGAGAGTTPIDITGGLYTKAGVSVIAAIPVNTVVGYTYSLSATKFTVYFRVKAVLPAIAGGATPVPTPGLAKITNAFTNTSLEFLSTRVPLVMEIGTLGNEANVIDVQEFGQPLKGKLRGQSDGGQLDSSIFWAPGNAVHNWLHQAATNGTPTTGGIKYKETQNAEPGQTQLAVFNSFVSSFNIETAFDDVMKASMTQPIDGNEYFAPGA